MIVTIGGIKGGSGKSTVATNLAVLRSQAGRDVLLIDADDQETATDFTALRNERMEGGAGYTSIKLTGAGVRTETLRLKDKYQDIVIDTGGRDTSSQRAAISVSDVLLVPFVPRSFDVWTIEKVGALVDEMRAANGSDNEDAAEMLGENTALRFIDTPLGARKAFSNAAADGLSVSEVRPPDSKANEEIMTLYRYIFNTDLVSE
jgi:chromosome partitioning protein